MATGTTGQVKAAIMGSTLSRPRERHDHDGSRLLKLPASILNERRTQVEVRGA